MSTSTIPPASSLAAEPALCVDLDGTLVWTDTLHEQLLQLVKKKPFAIVGVLVALFRGIAAFKRALARRTDFRPETLPYNQPLVAYLREQAAGGRRILLTSAADQTLANRVAQHLGIFEAAIGSDGVTNLNTRAKVAAIDRYLGGGSFEYAGDSGADVPVWKAASAAILVDTPERFRRVVRGFGIPITTEFRRKRLSLGTVLRAMRVYHWPKNALVFVPLFLSHTILQTAKLRPAIGAFVALCLAASFVYVVNDLLDLESDRNHPRKRQRPFASGELSIRRGLLLSGLLLGSAALTSIALPLRARELVALYVVASSLYSTLLKRMLFLDVIALAGLYALRILYGGTATQTVISPPTLAFSIFLFISLAICKRLTELRRGDSATLALLPGRAYSQNDLTVMTSLGSASGYAAVLVLALYISSPEVTVLYRRSDVLWGLCPLLAYWMSRMILIANRGNMHDDPILFACRDKASYAVAALVLVVVLAAI